MHEDWLDVEDAPAWVDEPDVDATYTAPPAVVAEPTDYAARLVLLESAWARLSDKQRVFLNTWRECRFNASRAVRVLADGPHSVSLRSVNTWKATPDFQTIITAWRGDAARDALDKDRLLARQDDIVETLLTPKPILHMGHPTGYTEVEASAAARANETLLKAAGVLKDKDAIDVNVGILGPSLTIQVVQTDGTVIDATPTFVPVALPEPADGA